MLNLSPDEKQQIVDQIRTSFDATVRQYNARMYPEEVYETLVNEFRLPALVTADGMRNALRWKYGHWLKPNYPEAHKAIIAKIQDNWAGFIDGHLYDAKKIFDHWTNVLEQHQIFITATFLTHLLRSDEIPIIDQNNFRAMNYYLGIVRPRWASRKKPSRFGDVLELREFMRSIVGHWADSGYPSGAFDKSFNLVAT